MFGKSFIKIKDDLILRSAARSDADELSALNARLYKQGISGGYDERIAAWTLDLLEGSHPTFKPEFFIVSEDTRLRKIVSAIALIPQTWSYGGVPFDVGQIEFMGTLPSYRDLGVEACLFEVVHQVSKRLGHKVQALARVTSDIKKYGYRMAFDLGGGRYGYKPHVPVLLHGDEPFKVEAAHKSDLEYIARLYERSKRRYLVNCERSKRIWNYEFSQKRQDSIDSLALQIITNNRGERVGYLAHPRVNWGSSITCLSYELDEEVAWDAVTPSVIRYLYPAGEAIAADRPGGPKLERYNFWLGEGHPVYPILGSTAPARCNPYCWYLRIDDLPSFLKLLTPVFEERLFSSPYNGFSGEFKILTDQETLVFALNAGKIIEIEAYETSNSLGSVEASFPNSAFISLLFGQRSLFELDMMNIGLNYRDRFSCEMFNALFRKQASNVWPLSRFEY